MKRVTGSLCRTYLWIESQRFFKRLEKACSTVDCQERERNELEPMSRNSNLLFKNGTVLPLDTQ